MELESGREGNGREGDGREGKGTEREANAHRCLTLPTFPLPLLAPFLDSPTPPLRRSPTHSRSLELYFHKMAAWLCSC